MAFPWLLNLFKGGLDCASVCEAGLVRAENQDSLFSDPVHRLFCVADGMGGGEGGALASRIVCEEVERAVAGRRSRGDRPTIAASNAGRMRAVDEALKRANGLIRDIATERGYRMMGSTAVVLLFDPAGREGARIGHVGDSRAYLRRGGQFKSLTRDHRKSAYSHVLTRAVGGADELEVEWTTVPVERGDVWLICTDGVHDMLPDSTLNGILAQGGSAARLAARLTAAIRRAGARDNFSFVLVRT